MQRKWILAALLIFGAVMFFASCGFSPLARGQEDELDGRILLWHTWSVTETVALDQVIDSFTDLHPNVMVKTRRFDSMDEMGLQYRFAQETGFGPDTIIAPSAWLDDLVAADEVTSIDNRVPENVRARYASSTLSLAQRDGKLYGLPQSLNTMALYYNKQRVETPVNTLDGLLAQANQGSTILLPTNFTDAFWGIPAFGGRLFNKDGLVILNQGGFANWLAWLRDARSINGMILDNNRTALRERFINGQAGYYFGYAGELAEIRMALGPENVGVMTLPQGPVGSAGPLLTSNMFMFSAVSSRNQQKIAVELASFVTNVEQSGRLMRQALHVPANTGVRINSQLNPFVSVFATQARTATATPTRPEYRTVVLRGNEAYARVLESGESPVDVAFSVTSAINEANGFAASDDPQHACTGLGTIRIGYTWQEEAAQSALQTVIERFQDRCPLIIVEKTSLSRSELNEVLNNGRAATPALLLIDQQDLLGLVDDEPLVKNLTPVAASETLQKFWPIGIDAMRVNGILYGLPLYLDVDALYYNPELVETPAQTVGDLRIEAGEGVPIVLDTRFEKAFWGIAAFGGEIFDENYRVLFDQGGFADWLAWLQVSRQTYGIQLTDDGDAIREQFLDGQTAYYVGPPQESAALRAQMAEDDGQVALTLLPQGPGGSARPMVRAHGFVLPQSIEANQQALAMEFIRFMTDVENQVFLMKELGLLPANATVSSEDMADYTVFAEQLQNGWLVPNADEMEAVERFGGRMYTGVLEEGLLPSEVVSQVTGLINEANGLPPLEPTPTPAADEADGTDDGEVSDAEGIGHPATGAPEADAPEADESETAEPEPVEPQPEEPAGNGS